MVKSITFKKIFWNIFENDKSTISSESFRKIEPRCYNILEKSLLSDVELPNQKLKSNYLSVQSQLMARICQDHAFNYGANFLKQLTDLMNSSQDILLITVNALSGIIALCAEGVIDSK